MAGGVGSRFWPMSRQAHPKQFLDILGTGKSFIRQTYERFAEFIPDSNFLVVTNANYKTEVLRQIPELDIDQVLCEPLGRNTAPCIAYAAYRLLAQDPEATMIVTPSDHYTSNQEVFKSVILNAADFADNNRALVTIGIRPNRPATGYGYIQVADTPVQNGVNKVKTFTEKPTLEVARAFLDSGDFFWNSGIFIWSVKTIIDAFEKWLPEIDSLFKSIADDYGKPSEREAIAKIYPECRNISIDYGIMEKTPDAYVICSDFGWSDIGTWESLYQNSRLTFDQNVANENTFAYNTTGTIIKVPSDKLVVVEGLKDYIVVESDNVLLICRRENEQNIKQFVEDVKLKKGNKFI
jgi:mannose-1-phosphate guanylyltransferase